MACTIAMTSTDLTNSVTTSMDDSDNTNPIILVNSINQMNPIHSPLPSDIPPPVIPPSVVPNVLPSRTMYIGVGLEMKFEDLIERFDIAENDTIETIGLKIKAESEGYSFSLSKCKATGAYFIGSLFPYHQNDLMLFYDCKNPLTEHLFETTQTYIISSEHVHSFV